MIIENGGPHQSLRQIVLFPMDDFSIPFQNGVELQLAGHKTPINRTRIVLGLGEEGAPDSQNVVYYGSVRKVGHELWMWYLGQGAQDDQWFERVCFARSTDGYHWEKPKLGLVEYGGNKDNNLVDLNQGRHPVTGCVVLYEPEHAERPFKMVFESPKYESQFAVAYSDDGLTWHESPNNPVGPLLEMSGLTEFNGCYYLAGQGFNHGLLRQLITFVSYDFERASVATTSRHALSFHNKTTRGSRCIWAQPCGTGETCSWGSMACGTGTPPTTDGCWRADSRLPDRCGRRRWLGATTAGSHGRALRSADSGTGVREHRG